MKENAENENLLNVREAAAYLGISISNVRRKLDPKINLHSIGFYRIGKRILFSKEQHLDIFLAECEVNLKAVAAVGE